MTRHLPESPGIDRGCRHVVMAGELRCGAVCSYGRRRAAWAAGDGLEAVAARERVTTTKPERRIALHLPWLGRRGCNMACGVRRGSVAGHALAHGAFGDARLPRGHEQLIAGRARARASPCLGCQFGNGVLPG